MRTEKFGSIFEGKSFIVTTLRLGIVGCFERTVLFVHVLLTVTPWTSDKTPGISAENDSPI